MILYLITQSQHYYPMDGTNDWIEVFDDEEEARESFELSPTDLDSESLYLIQIDATGWKTLDIR